MTGRLKLNPLDSPVHALAAATGLHPRQVRRVLNEPDEAPVSHVLRVLEAGGAYEVEVTVKYLDGREEREVRELHPDNELFKEPIGGRYVDKTPAIAVKLDGTSDADFGRKDLRERARRRWKLDRRRLKAHNPQRLLAIRRGVIVGAWSINDWKPDQDRIEFILDRDELSEFKGQLINVPGRAPVRYLP